MIDHFPGDLFGRHVGRRAHHHARFGLQAARLGRVAGLRRPRIFGQAEVENFHAAVIRDHHVGGLQVAMHNSLLMRGGQRSGERGADFEDAFDGEPAFGDQPVERLAGDEFHGEEMHVIGLLDGENGDDVRMIQRGYGPRFTLEAHQALRIARHFGGQNFQRHFAPQLGVGRAIDLTHATGANRGGDVVMGEPAVDQVEPPARHEIAARSCEVCAS